MERKPGETLTGGDGALRASVWEFMRPMLSTATASFHESAETTVDLAGHHAASDLDELALDNEPHAEAA